MSRIGRLPVAVPSGVKVDLDGSRVKVKGPKGEMERVFSSDIQISMENGAINVVRQSDEARYRALHGTTRALIHNMVVGVSTGFTRILEIDGVGYRAEMNGKNLVIYVGYSHPVDFPPPPGSALMWIQKPVKSRSPGRTRNRLARCQQIFAKFDLQSLIKGRASITWVNISVIRQANLVRQQKSKVMDYGTKISF